MLRHWTDPDAPWFCIEHRADSGARVRLDLRRLGFEVHWPREVVRVRGRDDVLRPFFPGYLFALPAATNASWHEVKERKQLGIFIVGVRETGKPARPPAGFVLGLVNRAGGAIDGVIPVKEDEIVELRRGDAVKLLDGPFAGADAIFHAERGKRIAVLEIEGLIRRDGAGLAVPLVQEGATRSEIARRNGSGGGRPRKGETREQYLARRQGEMIMPIAGGAAGKPSETQAAKPADPPLVVVEKRESIPLSTTPPEDARAPEWVSLGIEVAELARLDGARGGFDYRPVQAWLNEGISPDTIRAAVRHCAEWQGYAPGPIGTLAYFTKAVRRQHARALPAAPPPVPAMTPAEREDEAAACARIAARAEAHLASLSRLNAA